MRTVVVHRAEKLTGPWEGRLGLQDKGVAQGSIIDTPNGEWFAYLFRDFGAVGRIPYLVPVKWEAGWPVLGVDGKAPDTLDGLPPNRSLIPGIVASDEFDRKPGDPALPLVWQWNHNPDNAHWSLSDRPGFLRLTTGRVDEDLLRARNTLTQRTFGPESSASIAVDIGNMKDGDVAGLALLQRDYGLVGVKAEDGPVRPVQLRHQDHRRLRGCPLLPIEGIHHRRQLTYPKNQPRTPVQASQGSSRPDQQEMQQAATGPRVVVHAGQDHDGDRGGQ
jgi:beta-xylosidase